MAYFPYQNPYIYPQFPQQPMQQPMQQPVQQSGIIWVSGDAEADAFPIAPNNAVRLWHSSLPIVYFKSADASGKPTIKAYDLVERSQSASAAVLAQEGKDIDWAKKSDLDAISQAIDTLKGDVESLRKKIKKRREVEDDDDE